MQVPDYVTLLLFATGVLLSGLLLSRSGRSVRSFFNAGGSVPWPMAGLSLFMGFFSAGTFVVWGSIAYSYGWVSVTIQWGMCLAGIITGLFIAQKWNKTGVLTAAEYITSRLGVQTQKTYTLLFLFVSLFTFHNWIFSISSRENHSHIHRFISDGKYSPDRSGQHFICLIGRFEGGCSDGCLTVRHFIRGCPDCHPSLIPASRRRFFLVGGNSRGFL